MDWVSAYAKGRTPWDLTMVTPPLRALLRSGRHLKWNLPASGARVAVPGCGRGHDLRAWSAAGMRVTGFDIVPAVVDEARSLLAWNRASGEVLCRDVLGLAQEFGGAFDLIYDYTCFCSLPRYLRRSYATEMATILAPGGLFVHLAFPYGVDAQFDEGPPHPFDRAELDAVLGPEFGLVEEFEAEDSVAERQGFERWFVWRVLGETPEDVTES